MQEEIERRNYNSDIVRGYIHAVKEFAAYLGKSPELTGVPSWIITGATIPKATNKKIRAKSLVKPNPADEVRKPRIGADWVEVWMYFE
jgi:hypothetical protein